MGCLFCDHDNPGFHSCPRCGSLPRHRELAWFVANKVRLPEGAKVLEVGPAAVQLRYFPRFLGSARYTAVDIVPPPEGNRLTPPHRFLEMEMTRLTFSDQSFDLIVANHVLPFIRSDYQAMSQAHRCLKGRGMAILDVRINLPKTRKAAEVSVEAPEIYTEEYRREYGVEWAYGEDYLERLEAAGFFPRRIGLARLAGPEVSASQGFSPQSELTLAFKFLDEAERFLEAL